MKPLRVLIAIAAIAFFAIGIAGIGSGDTPGADEPAPSGAALAASKQAIENGDAKVMEGEEEFAEEDCGTCHAIAAIGANGILGPRLDTQDDSADEIAENIAFPRKDIAEGYEADLMPTDYSKRMSPKEISAVAAFITAASTSSQDQQGEGAPGSKPSDGDDDG